MTSSPAQFLFGEVKQERDRRPALREAEGTPCRTKL